MTTQRARVKPHILQPLTPVGIVVAFLILQILIPAWLVLPGLGAAGRPANAIGIGLLVLWVGAWLWREGHRSGRQPVRWLIGLYLLTTLAAYAAALDRGLPEIEDTAAARWLITTFAMCGFAFFVIDALKSRRDVDRVLIWLTRLIAMMSLVGIVQAVAGFDIAGAIQIPGLELNRDPIGLALRGDARLLRVTGTAMHSIEFGVVIAAATPIALHYAIFAKGRKQQITRWLTAGVMMFGVPLSISRAATLGIVAGIAILMVVWSWRVRLNVIVIGMVALIGYRLVQPGVLGTILSAFQNYGNDPSVQNRLSDYAPAGDFIADRPWLGRGYGTFLPDRYILLDNQLLLTTISAGVVGLVSFVLLFLVPYFLARSIRLRAPTQEARHRGQALAATVVVLFVTAATFDALWYGIYTTVLFLTVGAIGLLWRFDRDDGVRPLQPAKPGEWFVASPWMAAGPTPRPPFIVRRS